MPTCSTSTSKGGKTAANARPEAPVTRETPGTYHGFSDEMITSGWDDGFAYKGDGKDTIAFFDNNSNYDELIKSMNYDDKDAFEAWASGHWMRGQMYKKFSDLSYEDQKMIRAYDKILDKSELKESIVVTRRSTAEMILGKGRKTATLEELQAAEGRTVLCKSCLSTGAASEGLLIGSSSSAKPIEYSIKIPAGKGRGMWVGDERINPGWEAKQREFMTNRDAAYKIGKTKYDSKRGVYKVEITMLDVNTGSRHDYS